VRPAPLEDVCGADVPGEVDDHVARADVPPERLAVALLLDLLAGERRALLRDPARALLDVAEVDHRVLRALRRHVLEQQRQRAARNGAEPDHENPSLERCHP
jgi:hypothetical protein